MKILNFAIRVYRVSEASPFFGSLNNTSLYLQMCSFYSDHSGVCSKQTNAVIIQYEVAIVNSNEVEN